MATLAAPRATRRPGALYFPVMTTLLACLSFMAFTDNLITDVHQESNSDPALVIHGLIAGAWVILFAAQAWLIYLGRIATHRRLGNWTFAVGAGLIVTTLYLFVRKFHGWAEMEPEVLANRLLMPIFIVCVALAYARRNRPDWHKRLLLIGTLALLEPITARVYDPTFGLLVPLGISKAVDEALFLTYLFGSWALLVGSLWWYDRITLRRIHPVTLAGSGAIAAANAVAYLV